MRRLLTVLLVALGAVTLLAAPALASDNGEGLLGETDDKIVTGLSLGVLVFFTLVVVLGTVIQTALEKRKEARKAAALRQRTGW